MHWKRFEKGQIGMKSSVNFHLKGIGVGCGFFISGSGLPIHWDPNRFPHATVHIQVDMDGGVTVHTGAADIGQGSTTAVAQVVAEVLALPIEMIHVEKP